MFSMNDLSPEILELILSLLPKNDDDPNAVRPVFGGPAPSPSRFPLYATVCKRWQPHFEERTFRSLNIKSSEFEEFSLLMVGRRRNVLTHLKFQVVLPTYSENACARFERPVDKNRNDEAFTDCVQSLFDLLSLWENETHVKSTLRPMTLEMLDIHSPTDCRYRGKEKYEADRWNYEIGRRRDLWEKRWQYSFIHLMKSAALPAIERITDFRAPLIHPRRVSPSSIVFIATRLPNLRTFTWEANDQEQKYPEIRQQERYDLAQILPSLSKTSLRSFELEYSNTSITNHAARPVTALQSASPTIDHLSNAFHQFTQYSDLTSIKLTGPIVISPALFWPRFSQHTPSWPNLQTFIVEFNACTPFGEWYFIRDPSKNPSDDFVPTDQLDGEDEESATDSDSDPSDDDSMIWDSYHPIRDGHREGDIPTRRYRTWPDDEQILPLLKSMAKAAAHMPVLQKLSLSARVESNYEYEFAVEYGGPNICVDVRENDDKGRYKLYFYSGEWRPDEELLRLWELVVPQRNGGLLVKYLEA